MSPMRRSTWMPSRSIPGRFGRNGTAPGHRASVSYGSSVLLAGIEVAHRHGLGGRVDREDLVVRAHIEVQGLPQALRGLQEQSVAVLDRLADVVRQPAVGEGDVMSALQDHDLGVLVQPAGPGRGRHAGGNATHNDDLHGRPPRDRGSPGDSRGASRGRQCSEGPATALRGQRRPVLSDGRTLLCHPRSEGAVMARDRAGTRRPWRRWGRASRHASRSCCGANRGPARRPRWNRRPGADARPRGPAPPRGSRGLAAAGAAGPGRRGAHGQRHPARPCRAAGGPLARHRRHPRRCCCSTGSSTGYQRRSRPSLVLRRQVSDTRPDRPPRRSTARLRSLLPRHLAGADDLDLALVEHGSVGPANQALCGRDHGAR